MFKFEIPGRDPIIIENIVLDYNGTIAVDGEIIPEAFTLIPKLAENANIYVLTADTYGTVKKACESLPVTVKTFPRPNAAECKEEIVKGLSGGTACLGNGFNDILMFDLADLAISVMTDEGVCSELLPHADVCMPSIKAGLELFLKPDRLKATLRN